MAGGSGVSKWRVRGLLLANFYIVVHSVLWYWFDIRPWGKTAMSGVPSLVIGRINASAILVLLILASLFLFGRVFCGWACHLRGVVELGDWALKRSGLGERELLRSSHPWMFRAVALYMVLLPAALYLTTKGFHPELSLHDPAPLADLPGSGETFFHKTAFVNWKLSGVTAGTMLGSAVAVFFILFTITVFLSYCYGPGAFCRLLCPYAALFGAVVKISPVQSKITRIGQCTGCRACSDSCPQGIDVSREIFHLRGKVMSPDCIKCMACTDACTHEVLADRRGPAVLQARRIKLYERDRPGAAVSLQKPDGLPLLGEVASLLFSNLLGAFFSYFGAFFYFAGLALGFVVSRAVIKRSANTPEMRAQESEIPVSRRRS